MTDLTSDWYDAFWENLGDLDIDDDGASAIRLIGELLTQRAVNRYGDGLIGDEGNEVDLTASDQFLVRRIQDAAAAATAELIRETPNG